MKQRMVFIMSIRSLLVLSSLILQTGCAQFSGRSYLSEMEHDDSSYFHPKDDFPVVAGDSGRDWLSDSERQRRTTTAGDDFAQDPMAKSLRSELKHLENGQTQVDLEFYQAYSGAFTSTSEKIYFLKLPPYERRDYLVNQGIIKEGRSRAIASTNEMFVQRKNDILLGMKKNDVLESMGRPLRVEIAGNPRNENERWLYRLNGASKYIYFESGEVQGWE